MCPYIFSTLILGLFIFMCSLALYELYDTTQPPQKPSLLCLAHLYP